MRSERSWQVAPIQQPEDDAMALVTIVAAPQGAPNPEAPVIVDPVE
jgi:hypothetical protein